MEKLLKPYDKECMRMAMLKHEETFREQVYELHRLYRIQKMLMKDLERRKRNYSCTGQKAQQQTLDLERPADEYIAGAAVEEDEIELTLGPTSYYRRRKASDSGRSFSSSSSGSSQMMKRGNSGRSQYHHQINTTCNSEGGRNGGSDDVEEQLRVEEDRMKQPAWLFQVLSLNMT